MSALRLDDRPQLVARFGEGKRRLEFLLPRVVRRKRVSGLRFARRMNAQQLGREIDGGALGGLTRFFPAVRADAAELRLRFAQADVAADQMRFLQRHVQRHVIVELERDDFADALRRIEFRETAKERDAVLQMHDEVAFDQFGRNRAADRSARAGRRRAC